MKKVLVAMMLYAMSSVASSEWMKMGSNDGTTFYIDPTSIRRDGNFRKVWELQDYKKKDSPSGELSIRMLNEYDCKGERVRDLSISAHSENMAKGRVIVSNSTVGQWDYVAPQTPSAGKLNYVCSR